MKMGNSSGKIVRNAKSHKNYIAFDYAMNVYKGCDHGCIYCYARSSYYDRRNNFECVIPKTNALHIVMSDLMNKSKKGIILAGGVTDPYNSKEKEYRLSRNALKIIDGFGFGVSVITKSDLVVRDLDILIDIEKVAPSIVNFSITCSDDELCKKIEPFVSTSTERFKAIEMLSKNGVITGVLIDPLLPFITDTEQNITEIVKKSKDHGATYIYLASFVTMADVQRDYFYQEAEKHFPGITKKYIEKYGNYYRCFSENSKKLWNIFAETCDKENMNFDLRATNNELRQRYNSFGLSIDNT